MGTFRYVRTGLPLVVACALVTGFTPASATDGSADGPPVTAAATADATTVSPAPVSTEVEPPLGENGTTPAAEPTTAPTQRPAPTPKPTTETAGPAKPAGIATPEPAAQPSATAGPAGESSDATDPTEAAPGTETPVTKTPAARVPGPTTLASAPQLAAPKLTLINAVRNGTAGTAVPADWRITATAVRHKAGVKSVLGTAAGRAVELGAGQPYRLAGVEGPTGYTLLSLECDIGPGGTYVQLSDGEITLDAGEEATCIFTHAFQNIDITKRAWRTSDGTWGGNYPASSLELLNGASVPSGSTITWTYLVSNSGGTAINGIKVSDGQLPAGAIDCPADFLRPGAEMICNAVEPARSTP